MGSGSSKGQKEIIVDAERVSDEGEDAFFNGAKLTRQESVVDVYRDQTQLGGPPELSRSFSMQDLEAARNEDRQRRKKAKSVRWERKLNEFKKQFHATPSPLSRSMSVADISATYPTPSLPAKPATRTRRRTSSGMERVRSVADLTDKLDEMKRSVSSLPPPPPVPLKRERSQTIGRSQSMANLAT